MNIIDPLYKYNIIYIYVICGINVYIMDIIYMYYMKSKLSEIFFSINCTNKQTFCTN
jgi:hypothetical protein